MRRLIGMLAVGAVGLSVALAARTAEAICHPDAVRSGPTCIDRYEASVWKVPPTKPGLITKIKKGTVTLADLTSPGAVAAGVVQLGLAAGDLIAAGCKDFYAVSIAGVTPAHDINWFQAAAAARNSGKRLPSNAAWQAAALGTPDPGTDNGTTDCNIITAGAVTATGSRSNCVSDVGAFDMVGNLWEWVADWVPPFNGSCAAALFAGDDNCLAGTGQAAGTSALIRGGDLVDGTDAGVFAVFGNGTPSIAFSHVGFRAAR